MKNRKPIRNLKELQLEKLETKLRLTSSEQALLEKAKKAPSEALKATAIAAIPRILGPRLTLGAVKIIRSGISMVEAKRGKSQADLAWKKDLVSGAKDLGLATLTGFLGRFFKKK